MAGGRFLIFAAPERGAEGVEFLGVAALPATPELIASARETIPVAKRVEMISGSLLLCLAIMPGLCVGAQVKLRRTPRGSDPRMAQALAWSGLSLCVAYFVLALVYAWVAPPGPPAPRIDLLAMLPFCAYCAWVSFEFLETWATGAIRGRE